VISQRHEAAIKLMHIPVKLNTYSGSR